MSDFLPSVVCEEGDVRLQGGANIREGRVEVCVNETWSTVCDLGWSSVDANIVCGQLNFVNQGIMSAIEGYIAI